MSNVFPHLPSKTGEPAWEAAYLLPPQGRWSEEDFLKFHTTQMAELVNGHLEILPMPNIKHQRMLRLLLGQIEDIMPTGGLALFAPLPTKLFPGTIREPDLLYISPENLPGPEVEYPSRIDLAVEIRPHLSDNQQAFPARQQGPHLGRPHVILLARIGFAPKLAADVVKQIVQHPRLVSCRPPEKNIELPLLVALMRNHVDQRGFAHPRHAFYRD